MKSNEKIYHKVIDSGLGGKVILSVLFLILSLVVFTGCIPNNYTREEKKAFLREAKKVAADYLETAYSGAVIKEIEPETAVLEDGYELTEFASGQFVWQKQVYDFTVNAETGEVYTSVCFGEIKERLGEELFRGLGIVNSEAAIVSCDIRYLKGCEDPDIWVGVRSAFKNVFPEEEPDELFRKILEETDEYTFSMTLQYKGEEIPQEIMEGGAPFPTLLNVEIYHIGEEHELYEGEYNYLTLPSLSEEYLWRGYSSDTVEYVRNQVMERDGFQVVYNAYERTREQDTAKKYLYASDNLIGGGNIQIRMWYLYEDRYVYADDRYARVPHKFCQRHRKADIIYSTIKAAKEGME